MSAEYAQLHPLHLDYCRQEERVACQREYLESHVQRTVGDVACEHTDEWTYLTTDLKSVPTSVAVSSSVNSRTLISSSDRLGRYDAERHSRPRGIRLR